MSVRDLVMLACEAADWWFPPPEGFPHRCGSVGGCDDQHVDLVFSDLKCLRCGHEPCPCCETWCDVVDDDDSCPCYESNKCLYDAGRRPAFVRLDLQWMRSILVYLRTDYRWRDKASRAKVLADLGTLGADRDDLRLGIIARPHRLFTVGDAVLVRNQNGTGRRQPVYGYSSKGRQVADYVMKYQTYFYPRDALGKRRYENLDSVLRGPLMMPKLPGEVARFSPFHPGVSDYIRGQRAARPAPSG